MSSTNPRQPHECAAGHVDVNVYCELHRGHQGNHMGRTVIGQHWTSWGADRVPAGRPTADEVVAVLGTVAP